MSRSLTETCSFTLWIVALHGPSSTTSTSLGAMNRPSEVPPAVDSSVFSPERFSIAAWTAGIRAPAVVRKGGPESRQSRRKSVQCLSRISSVRCLSDSSVDSVEKRKLNSARSSPGMTLFAPVPAVMFDIWNVVAGKNSLPSSHRVVVSSTSAGALS